MTISALPWETAPCTLCHDAGHAETDCPAPIAINAVTCPADIRAHHLERLRGRLVQLVDGEALEVVAELPPVLAAGAPQDWLACMTALAQSSHKRDNEQLMYDVVTDIIVAIAGLAEARVAQEPT